ncbi:penicillin-binding protein 1A [Alginatibacterium sediminis]|uniref:Penicillin-binding protein 1A n=1 Tax=Alginatibacterium sediminis TaxID=2164068 RepID=A0A420EKZ1_9ALTE|nr:penicillin-binding protein 1A [Alginatibacterium sediminis]RKF21349.1 penicillin-binding protein 1A [Alginatibacterium sediminis]
MFSKMLKRLFYLCVFLGLCGIAGFVGLYYYFGQDLPDVKTLKEVQLQTPLRVYSADGELISQFGEKRRIPLELEQIPEQLIQAVLATEDTRFYMHPGIDPIGITRAAINLLATGEKSQGASTITQQVARNFFLSNEKTYVRKIKEIFLALKIEQELSKDEILALYLNKISLGYRSFGVGAAAQVYYGTTVDKLSLAQMAMIAGLPKAPSALNPIRSPERATERRRVVLLRMLDVGFIDRATYDATNAEPLTARYHGAEITLSAPYLAEMVRQEILRRYGEEAYETGMNVYTTVDSKRQHAATEALQQNLLAYDHRHGYRGAVASLWQEESEALTEEELDKALAQLPNYGPLQPAVVLNVEKEQAQIALKRSHRGSINWEEAKWARKYISSKRQSNPPKTIAEVLTVGDLIYVEAIETAIEEPNETGDGQSVSTPTEQLASDDAVDETEQIALQLPSNYKLSQLPDAGSALVALDPIDGSVEALVGGFSFSQSKFNRVTQAARQVGSNIKPFIYSAAMEQGKTLATIVNDAPINRWDPIMGVAWRPKNSPNVYDGPIRLRVALAKSKNVVSVRLIRDLSIDTTIDHLSKFGFVKDQLPPNESLSLGTASLTPLEVVRAYAVFANGGHLVDTHFISHIDDSQGERIYEPTIRFACLENDANPVCKDPEHEQRAPQVISSANAFLTSQALASGVYGGGSSKLKNRWNGTGWRATRLGRNDLGGKTGTTNDAKDAWFSGYGGGLVVTAWVGFDDFGRELGYASRHPGMGDKQAVGGEFGGQTAQPAWVSFMRDALEGTEEQPIPVPSDVVRLRIDSATGLLSRGGAYSQNEYFLKGTQPQRYSSGVGGAGASDSQAEELF